MIWVKLNIKQFKMRSEDRKLTPRDISRKSKKLEKTLRQLEGLNKGNKKYHRKMFKAEKTLDQLQTGKSGIRPNKTAFNMSGYKLPHMKNPIKQVVGSAGDKVLIDNDSISAVDAWKDFKSSYTNRKFRGNDERLGPITPEQNLAEYNREKNEFYYDTDAKKLKLIPTDDAEIQDQRFLDTLDSFQLPPKN